MAAKVETRGDSQLTKERILSAARRRFALDGYERTTIRAVAGDADIDPSMVMRYFVSKEGLFAAAASFDLRVPPLAQLPRSTRGARLAGHFLNVWENPGPNDGLAILLRTAATNEDAASRMHEIFRQQILPAIASATSDAPGVRAAFIASQLLGMAYCRYILKMPLAVALDHATIVANLGRTIQRYLHDPLVPATASGRSPSDRARRGKSSLPSTRKVSANE
jgi:AcrR family transcriptional regulator